MSEELAEYGAAERAEKTTQRRRDAEERPQIRARKAARGDRGLQMLNPRTTPLGVLLIAGLPTVSALEVVRDLETPDVIEQALRAESRCQSRSAVLAALKARLAARRLAEKSNTKGRKT